MSQERSLLELQFVADLEEFLINIAEEKADLAITIRILLDTLAKRREILTQELHDYYNPKSNPDMESNDE